jgi:hypothetical protein
LGLLALLSVLLLGSCGGGGGGGADCDTTNSCPVANDLGVFTGFPDSGNLNWESASAGDGGTGDGGASGDGGVGAGGDFGQFRGANICVFLDNGTQLGCALTDNLKGMVTIKPGRDYRGGLRIELSGTPTATYYEEGRDTFVPFPADRKIRVWVPAINRNIGITPFTEAAYRMLTEGSAPESVGGTTPTKAQIRAANERVRLALNEHFPTALHVDDIARLPFIKSQSLPAGSMSTDPRGRYGLVNGAFSKQASFHNSDTATPTLDAVRQLAEDMLDGRLDGRNGSASAAPAAARTYDPNTFTSELTSALAEQAARFGAQEALDVLPKVLNFGNVRYEGYLFDGSISKAGTANSTVAGWVAGNTKNFTTGQQFDRLPGRRALALFSNNGHGGGFYKADANGPRHRVYAIGDNVNGELGLGTRVSTNALAIEVTLPGAPSHIVGGFAHTVARMADGSVWAWGDNSFGQLGQNDAALANSLTPLRVTLPVSAVAVAASNVTSYALGADGKVYAWGANGGYGMLGNGSADGTALAPIEVAGLADIVQISARDNDVVVLRRDGAVWHWGSHPAPENAFVPGDPSAPYLGGTRTPVQIAGLPAGVGVRKILTEQGLFAVLLANGHIYTWGVHFDITAGQVLRGATQMAATRMLGLPPLRDMMPGGFQGYGTRAFDRLTGMGIDYSGGMWKIRGRVGEVFDPETAESRAAQRRPQGQGPRVDCEACHTFLDQPLADIKAASQQPTTGPECTPPSSAHDGQTASLIHAETDCVQCHNPGRLNYPVTTPSGNLPFAATGGWPNCVKPAGLPNRAPPTPPQVLSNSCTVPPNHIFTPPGTVCASCHNSILARPLRDTTVACAQPASSELPTIPTRVTIAGVFNDAGAAVASGATTTDRTPELRGTISAALTAGQSVEVQRNGTAIGIAAVTGTGFTFVDSGAPEGPVAYRMRFIAGANFGAFSNTVSFAVDSTPPAALASITGFTDDGLGPVASGGFAGDSTPTVNGTINVALGSGESVQVLRGGVVVGTATVSGTGWTYTEPAALAGGSYSWQARTVDAAGNITAASGAATLTIVGGVATATVTQIVNDANTVIAAGGATSDATPTIRGTVSAALPAGHVVRVLRDGASIGTATMGGTNWSLTDPGASDGLHAYTARAEAGSVIGTTSAAYAVTVDTVAPAQTANVTQIADDFVGGLANGATTADTTPVASGTLSVALAAGEQLRVLRNGAQVALLAPAGTTWSYTEPAPLANGTYTYQVQVVDAAGLQGPLGTTRAVTIDAAAIPLPNAAAFISTINGVAPAGAAVPANNVTTPALAGTIQRALNAGEAVRIYRGLNGSAPAYVGDAAVAATNWTYTSGALADGTYTFRAQIVVTATPTIFGLASATVTNPLDATAPAQAVTLTNLRENNGGTVVANAGYTTDTSPFLEGTLSAVLNAGEQLQVLRGGVVVGTASVVGASWTYSEGALAGGTYSYTLRVRDTAGNVGATSAARSVNIVTNLPTTTITTINGLGNGAATNDTSPQVNITLSANLPAGYVVRVFRDGVSQGTIAACANTCSFTDNLGATAGTTYNYTARTEVGGTALGTISNTRSIFLDTVEPAAPTMSGIADNKPYQNTTTSDTIQAFTTGTVADATPRVVASFGEALLAGEVARLYRWNGSTWIEVATGTTGSSLTYFETAPALNRPFEGAPGVIAPQRYYYATRTDAAGNVGSAPFITFNHGYLACSAPRARARAGQNHSAYSNASAFTVPIATCAGCHTTSGGYVAAPATDAYGDRYWCVR